MTEQTKNMIKKGVVSKVSDDSGNFPIFQMEYNGKVVDVEHTLPYGLYCSMPADNTSLCVVFNALGSEDNKFGFGNTPYIRFKDLKEGEVVVGNPLTRSKVHFKANGDIDVECSADNNVNIVGNSNVTIGGNATINVTGDTTVTMGGSMSATVGGSLDVDVTGNSTITSPVVTVDGELRATGEVTAFYGLPNALSFSGIRTKYDAHTHISNGIGNATAVPNNIPL